MTDAYPKDSIDRLLPATGSPSIIFSDDIEAIYEAASCPGQPHSGSIAQALARGLVARRAATEVFGETAKDLRAKARTCRDCADDATAEGYIRWTAKGSAYDHAAEMVESALRRAGLAK